VTFPRLTRRQDPVVARFRACATERDRTSTEVLLDGVHLVLDALRAGVSVHTILATGPLLDGDAPEVQELWSLAAAADVSIYDVPPPVMNAASPVRTPSGVVAMADWQPSPVDAIWTPPPALTVGLVDVQDPGNAGAVIRCADGLGATGVAMLGATADPGGWKALRGAMGSTFRLPVTRGETADVIAKARAAGVHVLATAARDVAGAIELRNADLRGPVLFLLGNEGAGLSATTQRDADVRVYIAMRPGLDSFNVSVTAGLLLYEARHQRGTP
jgi:TrmH family RNA methyltransferase